MTRDFDLIILGAGPAGLSAAVYGSTEGHRTLVVNGGRVGGQAGESALIENYLGFPDGLSGAQLADYGYRQATRFGTVFTDDRAVGIERDGTRVRVALASGETVRAASVVLAVGVEYRRLDVAGLDRCVGRGVYYGAMPGGSYGPGDHVVIVGGANSAGQAACALAGQGAAVTMLVRSQTSMSAYLDERVRACPTIRVVTGAEVTGCAHTEDGRLTHLTYAVGGAEVTEPVAALSVFIGATPRTEWLPAGIARNAAGYVLTGDDLPSWNLVGEGRSPEALETSLAGVFCAGDVRHGAVQRVASAAGEGALCITFANRHRRRVLAAEAQTCQLGAAAA